MRDSPDNSRISEALCPRPRPTWVWSSMEPSILSVPRSSPSAAGEPLRPWCISADAGLMDHEQAYGRGSGCMRNASSNAAFTIDAVATSAGCEEPRVDASQSGHHAQTLISSTSRQSISSVSSDGFETIITWMAAVAAGRRFRRCRSGRSCSWGSSSSSGGGDDNPSIGRPDCSRALGGSVARPHGRHPATRHGLQLVELGASRPVTVPITRA